MRALLDNTDDQSSCSVGQGASLVRVAAIGDIHIDERSAGRLRTHWLGLAEHADILLLAGDLTQLGTASQAKLLAAELDGLPVPAVAVLGNHDYHANEPERVRQVLESIGVIVLEGESATFEFNGETLGIAGVKGFGGGFRGANGHKFGEVEMKRFIEATEAAADALGLALARLTTHYKVALTHYAPVLETLKGEKAEILPFLGAWQLETAIDSGRADFAVHGHAHYGSPVGRTGGGIPVYNVALPLLRAPYRVFALPLT